MKEDEKYNDLLSCLYKNNNAIHIMLYISLKFGDKFELTSCCQKIVCKYLMAAVLAVSSRLRHAILQESSSKQKVNNLK